MAETIKGNTTRIRYDGVFDWNQLYSIITKWYHKGKYDYYEDKNVKKPGTYGYEREYEAHGEREESGYVRYDVEIKIHGNHMEDIEVIENGAKKNKNKTGMIVIDITPMVVLDWQGKWDKKFKKKARDFIHKYIVSGYVYEQLDKIYYETYKLHTQIKEELNLESKYSAY